MAGEVKVISSTHTGAPSLQGVANSLIALLDACLVNGFNSQSVTSITRAGSTATLTTPAAHNFVTGQVVNVSGAGQTEYNGDFPITSVTSTTFNYTVTGTPVTPATGTITVKAAPLGFTKSYFDTNKAVYRSSDVGGTRFYLRVLDDGTTGSTTKCAAIRGYETMTTVDSGTGDFPTSAQVVAGLTVWKSSTTDTTNRSWVLVGDSRAFYLFVAWHASYLSSYSGYFFGDINSHKTGDAYHCLICGSTTTTQPTTPEGSNAFHVLRSNLTASTSSGKYIAREHNQIGTAVLADFIGDYAGAHGTTSCGFGTMMAYPAPSNNGLYISPVSVAYSSLVRGNMPGMYHPLHQRPLGHLGSTDSIVGLTGRTVKSIATPGSGANTGETCFDTTGPWR